MNKNVKIEFIDIFIDKQKFLLFFNIKLFKIKRKLLSLRSFFHNNLF
jgi:hypothetical protein